MKELNVELWSSTEMSEMRYRSVVAKAGRLQRRRGALSLNFLGLNPLSPGRRSLFSRSLVSKEYLSQVYSTTRLLGAHEIQQARLETDMSVLISLRSGLVVAAGSPKA